MSRAVKRLLWFAWLWMAGVLCVGALAMLIKLIARI
jgi:hypothetical protein